MFPFLKVNTVMLTIILFAILWQQLCDISLLVLWGQTVYDYCLMSICTVPILCYIQAIAFPSITMADPCITHTAVWVDCQCPPVSLVDCYSAVSSLQIILQRSICLLGRHCTAAMHTAIVLATASHFALSFSFILSYRYHFLRLHCALVILPAFAVSLFKPSSLILFPFLLLLLHYSKVRQVELLSRIDVTTTRHQQHILQSKSESKLKVEKTLRKAAQAVYKISKIFGVCSLHAESRRKVSLLYDCVNVCLCKASKLYHEKQ